MADIFERFRQIARETYKLDPAHYLSAPQLSFDAAKLITRVNYELLSDTAMHYMVDEGIRGGVAMITTRFARANNPLVPGFDQTKPTSWIKGLDANNLYGWAMSQYLPLSDFEWLEPAEILKIDWLAQKDEQEFGYILCADLVYPQVLHDKHNDYPMAPERMQIQPTMISETQVKLRAQYKMPRNSAYTKLVPNLLNKREYVLHYRLYKYYLEHGLVGSKIHKVIKFRQSPWLKKYIELNQAKRAEASTEFDKEFYKLMNNAVFGKTCEKQKKPTNIRLVQSIQKLALAANNPAFMDARIFREDLAAVELQKKHMRINRPTYAGFAILDLAKLLMYRCARHSNSNSLVLL